MKILRRKREKKGKKHPYMHPSIPIPAILSIITLDQPIGTVS